MPNESDEDRIMIAIGYQVRHLLGETGIADDY
jgi:hypothetical protein